MLYSCLIALLLAGQGQLSLSEQPVLVTHLSEILDRAASGHSPTNEEIMAAENDPGLTSGDVATALVPLLKRALSHPDAAVRQYGLAMLVGIQTLPDAKITQPERPAGKSPTPDPSQGMSARYQADVAKALVPLIRILGSRLTDERFDNRELAATDLGGFAPNPPPSIFQPLLAFLQRDDAVGSVGLAVVSDLLNFGPVNAMTADAITLYLQRTDQTAESRASLVEAIASKLNQSQKVNQALTSFLDSGDPNLRARVILALPGLDLSGDSFARLKARVGELAAVGSQDNPEVVSAARAITACWTLVKMEKGCPPD